MIEPALSKLEIRRHDGLEGLALAAPGWRALIQRSGQGPLIGPDWIAAHISAYELDHRFHLLTAEDEAGLAAALPLVRQRGWIRGVPVRQLTGAVGLSTLRFDLAAEPGPRGQRAAAVLWRQLETWPGWTCIALQPVPEGAAADALLAGAAAAGYPVLRVPLFRSPRIDLSRGFEAAMAVPKSHFRSNLRRNRRRLEELGPLRLEAQVQPTAQDMEAFFSLEAAGWKGHDREGRAVLVRPQAQRNFYQQLAAAAGSRGELRLHRLWLGDRVIAASLGLLDARAYYAVKWCYDEGYANYGPGHVLVEALLRECAAMHLEVFDFTGPEYEYKRDWTPAALDHFILYVFRPNWRGRALHRWKRQPLPGR